MITINFYNQTNEDVEIYETVVTNVVKDAASYEGLSGKNSCNYIFVDNDQIQALNSEYRRKDYATDVLTFAAQDELLLGSKKTLGDVFISVDKMREQAYEYGHGEVRELSFLAVHGFLHLLGYDHLTVEQEEEMFTKQEAILDGQNIRR